MTVVSIRRPEFHPTQWVSFAGGEGIVQSCTSESGSWTYLIKMTMGSEPDFGRLGAETTVVFDEADLRAA
jgi:hypothetical protein